MQNEHGKTDISFDGGDVGRSFISGVADKESEGENMQGMPIGEDDFRELRKADLYYVDKSLFIHRLLESKAKVTLITRPRRFGKSLNISMTDAYFNAEYADGPDYFEGLKISEARPNDPEKNSNIVISISLKDLGDGTYASFLSEFEKAAFWLYHGFLRLRDSDRLDPSLVEMYDRIYERRSVEADLTTCIRDLSKILETHYGKKVIILIDEYDNAMNNAYGKPEEHEKIVKFMRTLLSTALKGNKSLRFAVVTGVMKISQESIFSGLNNFEIDDVFSTEYDEMFGFTQDEVEWLLRENGREDKIDEAREWYDGYRFGNEDVYNPWSILSYIKKDCKPASYWAGTSGNDIIGDLISKAYQSTWDDLTDLCNGKTIEADIQSNIAYCDLESAEDTIHSVMVAAGYLKAIPDTEGHDGRDAGEDDRKENDDVTYLVSIPNKEMFKVFSKTILRRFGTGVNKSLTNLIRALKAGKAEEVRENLRKLMEIVSVRILDNEFPYEAFIAGLMAKTSGQYEILADHEAGDGYFDIRMKRISGRGPNLVLEIKRRNENNKHLTMDELAREALKQIHDKNYCYGLEGKTIQVGIAFDGKEPTVVMERHVPER